MLGSCGHAIQIEMEVTKRRDNVDLFLALLSDFQGYTLPDLSLSAEERERGNNMISPKKREEFLLTRYLVRSLLEIFLNIPAATIPLRWTGKGKPYVAEDSFSHAPPLYFSVSHSTGRVLLSFSFGRKTGVDIEKRRALRNMEDFVSYTFPEEEQDVWKSLSSSKREDFFFRTWTRREAAIKCLGLSVAEDIHSFLIREDFCTNTEGDHGSWHTELKGISLYGKDIPLNVPWYSALAWEGEVRKISLFRANPGPSTTDQPRIKLLREIVQE